MKADPFIQFPAWALYNNFHPRLSLSSQYQPCCEEHLARSCRVTECSWVAFESEASPPLDRQSPVQTTGAICKNRDCRPERCQTCLQNSAHGAGGILEICLLLHTSTWVPGQAFCIISHCARSDCRLGPASCNCQPEVPQYLVKGEPGELKQESLQPLRYRPRWTSAQALVLAWACRTGSTAGGHGPGTSPCLALFRRARL